MVRMGDSAEQRIADGKENPDAALNFCETGEILSGFLTELIAPGLNRGRRTGMVRTGCSGDRINCKRVRGALTVEQKLVELVATVFCVPVGR